MLTDPDQFAEKKRLIEAAIAVYRDTPESVTTQAICDVARMDRLTFAAYFDEPEDALRGFYRIIFTQYHLLRLSTEGYERFTFEERLATFLYILIDALGEQRAFVQDTFDSPLRRSADVRSQICTELQRLVSNETVPDSNQYVAKQPVVLSLCTEAVMRIIRFWIHDGSPQQQATTALIDKLVGFTADVVTFRGVERGADLAWYAAKVDVLGLRHLPVVRWLWS